MRHTAQFLFYLTMNLHSKLKRNIQNDDASVKLETFFSYLSKLKIVNLYEINLRFYAYKMLKHKNKKKMLK